MCPGHSQRDASNVDIISLFSRVHVSTVKLKTFVQQSSHQHLTNHRRPVVAIQAESSNSAVVGACMMTGRATAVCYVCANCKFSILVQNSICLAIRKIKTPRKLSFRVFGANPQNIVPKKISTYTVHVPHTHARTHARTHAHTHTHLQ